MNVPETTSFMGGIAPILTLTLPTMDRKDTADAEAAVQEAEQELLRESTSPRSLDGDRVTLLTARERRDRAEQILSQGLRRIEKRTFSDGNFPPSIEEHKEQARLHLAQRGIRTLANKERGLPFDFRTYAQYYRARSYSSSPVPRFSRLSSDGSDGRGSRSSSPNPRRESFDSSYNYLRTLGGDQRIRIPEAPE